MNLKEIKQIENTIIEHRRYIHQHPELGFKEYNTHNYITKCLANLNIQYQTIGSTGIVATIGNITKYKDNCVALRAELDALPINEDTNLPFTSVNRGIMHACGHDMHIAMLLGVAQILQENVDKLKGCVKLIFQPGEEILPGGAVEMIENGCLQNPVPKMIFGGHIDPNLEVGMFEATSGEAMAASCEITIKVKGKATHGATTHLGSDPLVVAANIINFAQTFIVRYNNPLQPAILSICANDGGTTNNAFPNEVTMLGTLRTFNEESRNRLIEIFTNKVKLLCEVYDTTCEIDVILGYPPVINNLDAVNVIKESVMLMDNGQFGFCPPKVWAEDFAYYAKLIPACFYFIGCRKKDCVVDAKGSLVQQAKLIQQLHSNKLSPDEAALCLGAAVILNIVKLTINN